MPKSVAVSVVAAILGCVVYAIWLPDSDSPPDRRDYISVALDCFTISAIVCLFIIFYRYEKENNEAFGEVVRNNISTVVIALLIQFIGTGIDIFSRFRP